jgi:hypothetical protein
MTQNAVCDCCAAPIAPHLDPRDKGLCMVCKLNALPDSARASLPANPEKWSPESRKADRYGVATHYFDEYFWCRCCSTLAVFTAEAQRKTYEERKAYIGQTRVLCSACHETRANMRAELNAFQARWQTDRMELQSNVQFLEGWLNLLRDHARHGGEADEGNIQMVTRLLNELAGTSR